MSIQRAGMRIERDVHSSYWPVLLYVLLFIIGFYMHNHPDTYPAFSWEGLFTLAFLYEGTYCVRNFIHCREAHCVITGTGWTIIGLLSLLSTFGVFSLKDWGTYWIAFFVVYVIGMSFQYAYHLTRHTIQLRW